MDSVLHPSVTADDCDARNQAKLAASASWIERLSDLHNYPRLARVGKLVIATYGPAMGASFSLGFLAAVWFDANTGQDPREKLWFYLVGLFPAILLGARGASIMLDVAELRRTPLRAIFKPGYMLQGGILGAAAALFAYHIYSGVPFLCLADAGAFAMPLGEALGRIGCHLYGCCWGRPTLHAISVTYRDADSKVCRCAPALRGRPLHPAALYAAVTYFVLFIGFLLLFPHVKQAGIFTAIYLVVHPLIRYALEFFRDDDRGKIGRLTHTNLYSLAMFASGAFVAVQVMQNAEAEQGMFGQATTSLCHLLADPSVSVPLAMLGVGAIFAFGVHVGKIGTWLGSHDASTAPLATSIRPVR